MRKIVIQLLVVLFCTSIAKAQNLETVFKVKYKNNKILVEDQSPFNLWLINQREYTFDISDASLAGQTLSFSFANDAAQNNLPNSSAYYKKTGKEGEVNATIKVNMDINGMEPKLVVYLYSENQTGAGNKIYFSNYLNEDYTFFNNKMYKQYNVTKLFDAKLGYQLNENVPFSGNEEIGLYVDLNKDKNLDLVYAKDQIYSNGSVFNTAKLMVPTYFTILHNKEQENPITINISSEDLSKPNSTPKTLLHNWDTKTEIDLDGDGIKELINWGEHYHVGPSPLWKDVATQLGMVNGVDYGPSSTVAGATFYDPVFYLRKFRYYKLDSNRLIDMVNKLPAYNILTGSFFGAAGDVDKDGDNDIVLKANNGKGKILYNNGKGLFDTSLDAADEIPRKYTGEDFYRSDGFHYPYLTDMNNDGYPDWILTLNAPNPTEPIRVVYYPNNKGVFDIINPVDIIPKNNVYGKDNVLSYPIIQMKEVDLNNDGTKELIFLFGTVSNQDYLNILPRNIFKIISITKNGNVDVTSTYFPNNTNIIETGNAMKGFNIIDVDGDNKLDFLPRFEMYDPAYATWFPTGSWRGYWNNKTTFQYYRFNGTSYEIKSLGKILSGVNTSPNSNTPNTIQEAQTLTNYIEVVDLNKDNIPEFFYTKSAQGYLNKPVNDFSIGVKSIDVKDIVSKGAYIGSVQVQGYDSNQIELTVVNPTTDSSIVIKNNNQIFLNQTLDRSKNLYHIALIKIKHKSLNITNFGYVKINATPNIPEQPKIITINSDSANNSIFCFDIPGSIRIKSDSVSQTDKFVFEISTDSNFSSVVSIESSNSQIQYNFTSSNIYYVKVKASNKNGVSTYSPSKSFVIKAIPSAPTITRDTANNLVSSSIYGNVWFKNSVQLSDTSKILKPTQVGSYTLKKSFQGCISPQSVAYYYLLTDILKISDFEFIKLAPNPFINKLNFDFVVKDIQKLNMDVFDITTGNKVASFKGLTSGTPVYLGHLYAGTYLIKITSVDNKINHQFKMIKL